MKLTPFVLSITLSLTVGLVSQNGLADEPGETVKRVLKEVPLTELLSKLFLLFRLARQPNHSGKQAPR